MAAFRQARRITGTAAPGRWRPADATATLLSETIAKLEARCSVSTVSCEGIAPEDWPEAVSDVREEFRSRQWHRIIDVRWSGRTLMLIAENDYDLDGESIADEFSDAIAAYAPGTPGYSVRIISVAKQ